MKTADQILTEALPHFGHYLNLWWNHHEPQEPDAYKVESFTLWDPENSFYGDTQVLHDTGQFQSQGLLAGPDRIVIADLTDGDEGGPNTLVIMVRDDDIDCIVQYFDTMPSCVWTSAEGYRTPPDGLMKAPE